MAKNPAKSNCDCAFLTSLQAAKFLKVSLATLKKMIYSGKLRTFKTPGGHHRILEGDLYHLFYSQPLYPRLKDSRNKTVLEVAHALLAAIEKRQKFCRGHSAQVESICSRLAIKLKFTSQQKQRLSLACLLHDIGMLEVEESILSKPFPLSEKEYALIQRHAASGEGILASMEYFRDIARIVRQHHEAFDGSGYPDGLKGEEICPQARLIAIADTYACMKAADCYKQPVSGPEALNEILKHAGSKFDPEFAGAFGDICRGGLADSVKV